MTLVVLPRFMRITYMRVKMAVNGFLSWGRFLRPLWSVICADSAACQHFDLTMRKARTHPGGGMCGLLAWFLDCYAHKPINASSVSGCSTSRERIGSSSPSVSL
jgi:hypothetical protein